MSDSSDLIETSNEEELDKTIRKVISRVRSHYLQHGDSANRIPAEIKKIIEDDLKRF